MVFFPVDRSNIEDNCVSRFLLFAFWICSVAAVPFWNGWVKRFWTRAFSFCVDQKGKGRGCFSLHLVCPMQDLGLFDPLTQIPHHIHIINAFHKLNRLHLKTDHLCFSCLHNHRVVNVKLLKGCSESNFAWLNYTLEEKNTMSFCEEVSFFHLGQHLSFIYNSMFKISHFRYRS